MHQDRAIAGVLDETARAMEASTAAPRGDVMQAVMGSGLSDEAYAALTALVDAPGGEEAIRAVIRRAAARLLWDLAIVADEQREVGGAVLRLGVKDGSGVQWSEGSVHEELMARLMERGVEW